MRGVPHLVAVLVLACPVLLHGLNLTPDLQDFVSTLEKYAKQKNDIVFVLDESGSIGAENFPAELTFTELMARLLVVSEDFSRLAVVTFSNDNVKHIDQISGGGNMCGFVQQVNKIPYRTGGTRTKEALQYASHLLHNGRTDVNRIIVLISDGQANSGSEPNYVARDLKSQGITIFAVGVAGINRDELEAVATSQEHIYMLRNFAYIKQVNDDLRTDIRESQWDGVAVQECLRESGQCDSNAICACGAQGGTHRCVCKPGYEGGGTVGNCQRCGRGTYKEHAGSNNCKPCPPNSTTSGEGSTTEAQCSCIPGYKGDPGGHVACSPIQCAPLSDPAGGSTIPRKCGTSFGDRCDFLCTEGQCPYQCDRAMLAAGDLPWNRVTKVPRVCQADKTWSGPEFFCERVRCPALQPPANGVLNCSSTTLEFGTTCTPGCNLGYNITGGDPYLTCSIQGSWKGHMPTCKVVECQALKVNDKLDVSPGNCKKRPSAYDFLCQYHCKEGWTLVDRDTKKPVDGVRKCLADGTWLNAKQKITCQDVQKPMIVHCPQDMTVYNAPGRPFSDPVQWKEPVSTDNSGSSTVKLVFPLEITTLPHEFPIGEHDIQYVATDAVGLTSDPCAFKVFVIDVENPLVTFCPDNILTVSGTRETNVTWEEPRFLDYGPGELQVIKDREPGSTFSWGPPSTVTYHATDASENTATCSFQVIVKPYKCPYVAPPKHGFVTCDSETERQFCSVYCDQGYEFVFKPDALYRCKQTKQGGHWSTFSRNHRFPWPDCAVSSRSKKTDFTVDFKFATNSCQISEKRKAELKKRFFERLSKKLKRFPGMCEASQGCTLDNVHIACDAKTPLDNVPRVQRRDTGVRITRSQSDDEFDLRISFRIPFGGDFNATHLVEACEHCKNASLFHPSTAQEAALTAILEEASTEAVNSTVSELLPDALLVEAAHSIISVCERGQVSNGLLCVNCPVGTFYGNETSCTPCPIGTYSDREAADSCVPCPANKTTLTEKASSESECRALCKPGTWSTTGKEPCVACGTDAYQDRSGQSSCKKCSAGLSTGQWGAESSTSCRDICDAGTYSKNGLKPCNACPIGHYQHGRNQTTCIACDAGLSTRMTGTISKSDCVAPDYCKRLQPCANGSTCVDEPSGYRCVCPPGLGGTRCELDADDCAPGLCQNGARCIDGRDSFTCLCPPGYVGSACEIDEDDCVSAPCLNGATCIDGVNEFTCHCAGGFTGKRCEAAFHHCAMMPCRNGGSCFESFAGFRCCCPKGFTGERCELVQRACSPNPCANSGTCVATDSFECACAPGYEGDLCDRDADECASQPCLNGGTCAGGRRSFSCHCSGLYEGATCAAVRSSQFSLHFPNASVLNFAKLPVSRALHALTLAFYLKTSQTKERGTVVSYAFVDPRTKTLHDNALTISDPNKLLLYVFGESYDTQAVANDGQWHHCAVTWDSADGQWVFYWDQRVTAQDTRAAGEYLFAGVLVLGQDQDDLGGDFNGIEAYSGHVAELNLWDYAMSPDEVKQLSLTCGLAGNVVSWPELHQVATRGLVTDDYAEPCKTTPSSMDVSCHSASSSLESRTRCSRRVPPCNTSPCQNEQQCIENDDGSSECRCSESYEGRYCQYDVDECLFGSHNCSHLCVNTRGSYACACPPGTTLGDDGAACLDTSYCTYGLSTYLEGESWERDCQHCTCGKGVATCSPIVCTAVSCGAGQVLFKKSDHCCPSCVEEQPKCLLLKNSTLVTFDGLSFPLSRESEFVMFQDCHHGHFYGHVSLSKQEVAARVLVRCTSATLFSNGSAAVDGQLVPLPHGGGAVALEARGGALELRVRRHGLVVALHANGTVVASLPHGFGGKTCGLCGNANGQVRDDLTTKHHISAKTTEEFLASWRLPAKDREGRKNKYAACSDLPHSVAKSAIQTCRMIRNNKNLQACFRRLENPWVFFENCVEQMCSCRGNGYCYCDAFAAFKLACEQRNITFNQLPGKTCESLCPAGMEFQTCGPVNIPRCSPQKKLARDSCMPGCFCPSFKVLHEGQCIDRESCPATPWRNFRRTYSGNEMS
ncbi:sushi, von Willebrand factor type A, EGF and pentraxin domain-containing protein 1-like isoform X1 [Dermacentor variabilis]|uniref:sushi, von Willebrand factor type A, EGF and pentraxin domain-containing protein 1-like isoform X1 n=1 Tax=Dermacentor variabilis TaxID=34621 RepID=UPI003F5C76AD